MIARFIDNVLQRIVVIVVFLLFLGGLVLAAFALTETPVGDSSLIAVAPDGSLVSPPVDPTQACMDIFSDPAMQRSLSDEGVLQGQTTAQLCAAAAQEPPTGEEFSLGLRVVPDFRDFQVIPDAAGATPVTVPLQALRGAPAIPPAGGNDPPTNRGPGTDTGGGLASGGDREHLPDGIRAPPQECACEWVVNIVGTPEPIRQTSYKTPDKDNPNSFFGTTHFGNTLAFRTLHGLQDNFANDCPGAGGNASIEQGFLILTSKISCTPVGCCTPKGKTKAISYYKSSAGANTSTGFCFGASNIANALGADGVLFFVDGAPITGGSGAILATSGSAVIGSISLGVGATGEVSKDGPKLSGTGSLAVSASQVKADGLAQDSLFKLGSKEVANPGMVAELQSGGRTLANLSGKGSSAAEQLANLSGLGMFGVETQCGAGTFSAYSAPRTNGPRGEAEIKAFRVRYNALRDQFLP